MPAGVYIYAQTVNVAPDPSVVFGPGGVPVHGEFLVRYVSVRGGATPWRIAAILDGTTTVRVGTAAATAAMTGEQLRAAVADGSMDGRLVMLTGILQVAYRLCTGLDPGQCTMLFTIPGVDGVDVTWDRPLTSSVGVPPDGASPVPLAPGALLLTPRNGRLALLGRFDGDLDRPASITDLLYRRGPIRVDDPFALTAVAGWLVVGGIHSCPMLGPGATPCPGPGPLLTDKQPFPEGMMASDLQTQVGIWPGAVGFVRTQAVTPGPFLYRVVVNPPCAGPDRACDGVLVWSWEVMARYDAADVTRVALP
jgi:hypothetical protein